MKTRREIEARIKEYHEVMEEAASHKRCGECPPTEYQYEMQYRVANQSQKLLNWVLGDV
jgi:hypothetical protein